MRIGVVAAVAITAFLLAGCTHDGGDAGEAAPTPISTQSHVATLGQWIKNPTEFMQCTGVTGVGILDYAPGRGAATAERAVRQAFKAMDNSQYTPQLVSSGTRRHGEGFAQYIAFAEDHSVAFTTAYLDPNNLTWRASHVDGCEHHEPFEIPAGSDSVSAS